MNEIIGSILLGIFYLVLALILSLIISLVFSLMKLLFFGDKEYVRCPSCNKKIEWKGYSTDYCDTCNKSVKVNNND